MNEIRRPAPDFMMLDLRENEYVNKICTVEFLDLQIIKLFFVEKLNMVLSQFKDVATRLQVDNVITMKSLLLSSMDAA